MDVSEIIESVDILSYISQFCDLEERQDGEYWGLSPLKDENTPSFSVNVEKQRFYDFSSGKGGNIIDFIKEYHGCDFHKGLQILKEYANIKDDDPSKKFQKLQATAVAKKFKTRKKKGNGSKGVTLSSDYMKRYEKRSDKLDCWVKEGISHKSLDKFKVYYDAFANRLVYPIFNTKGQIVNVCGRTLDPDWKAKGLRKYTYYHKWGECMDVIYGLYENMDEIMSAKKLIIFEGAKSVLLADTYGIHNTCAILTSHFSTEQMKILISLRLNEIILALDKDVDVRSLEKLNFLKAYVKISYIYDSGNLLDDKDSPTDKGREIFIKLLNERKRWV